MKTLLKALWVVLLVLVLSPFYPAAGQESLCLDNKGQLIDCSSAHANKLVSPEQRQKIQAARNPQDVPDISAWYCNRTWTYLYHKLGYQAGYDWVQYLKGNSWGAFWELREFDDGSYTQDSQVRNILLTQGPFTSRDLIMIDVSYDAWWTALSQSTVDMLMAASQQGLRIVFVAEYYGFAEDEIVTFFNNLPTGFIFDNSHWSVQEPNPAYWLPDYNRDDWFYGEFTNPSWGLAGAYLATGNFKNRPGYNSATTIIKSHTDGYALLVEEGNIKALADSSAIGDLAELSYGTGSSGDIRQQAAFWACANLPGVPTAVDMISFEAYSQSGGTQIFWETAIEYDILGFNLYRTTLVEGEEPVFDPDLALKVNDQMIIPRLGLEGGVYTYTDITSISGEKYAYWLVVSNVDGDTQDFGPALIQTSYFVSLPLVSR